MKQLLLLSILTCLLFLYSCDFRKKRNNISLDLEYDAGKLKLDYPRELDTIFTWIDYSDYSCGHRRKTRISKSKLRNVKETGFAYSVDFPDTINQITIIQPDYPDCYQDYELADLLAASLGVYEEKYTGYSMLWLKKDIQTISGSNFGILGLEVYDDVSKKLIDSSIEIFTLRNNELITIEFYCKNDNCEGFVEEKLTEIERIKLD
ncbi:hypothetical protein [Flavilitoribacter nigricans]|uniref:Lipoprotein n=1 Tax=Flavilitoribacter nigricans (strain ATCC 23147 / DSM 23189 / NBRC 102662 / NCIMB 1420 / SS-2) TaxID=1122177 RepID=A0A2D0NIZ5_FLAN2|nr:hypothetical protein [Flavilitoribacter nigricans]PHN08475.1 hypothetical protein CRP01_00750 [Flavilitoribacter nigricans DSM 23189 = NBRC 102662]